MRQTLLILVLCTLLGACEPTARQPTLHEPDGIPERLSDWGILVTDGKHLRLGDGVVPYDLNTPLFTDYALKLRTVWMPTGTQANYREDRELDFPVGTVISKTFHYEKAASWSAESFAVVQAERESALDENRRLDLGKHVLVETRLLIRYEEGWSALPYVWNEEQTDAFLEIAGDARRISLLSGEGVTDATYIVPDANQCAGCHVTDHSAREMRPIGPKAWQLDRPYSWWGNDASQLDNWSTNDLVADFDGAAPGGVMWLDPDSGSLEERARAYLDANCAHCHNPAGAADTSALHLNLDAPVDRLFGVCKTPVAVGRGSGDRPFDIYPGRPDDSIMVFRMEHTDPAIAMPELGRSTVHGEGVRVIRDWISSLNGDCG
jgi:uncharacterized repeat protein (TIGR03806 family)